MIIRLLLCLFQRIVLEEIFWTILADSTDFDKSKVNFVMVMVEGRTTWRCQYILGDTVLHGSGSTKNSALDNQPTKTMMFYLKF